MTSAEIRDRVAQLKTSVAHSVGKKDKYVSTTQVDDWNEWRRRHRGEKLCLEHEDLSGLDLSYANFREANLRGANLSFCQLVETDFVRSDLTDAQLRESFLYGALMDHANLTHASMMKATLWWVTLVEADLSNADISECKVYGVSPWNVKLDGTRQNNLNICPSNTEPLTVDDLEMAHFLYLLLNNKKVRNVVDATTSRVVLILGRFTGERKRILDRLKDALRERNYVPLLFDFDPSEKRDLTETVQLMANMSRFVIADITDAKSIPQELSSIIPNLPSVPVQPILLASDQGWAMFEHWKGYKSVLPVLEYRNERDLLDNLDVRVMGAVDAWKNGFDEACRLRQENKQLRDRVKALEAAKSGSGEST